MILKRRVNHLHQPKRRKQRKKLLFLYPKEKLHSKFNKKWKLRKKEREKNKRK
jgi:hypothetical protein